jgi:hypothetical protein
VERRASGEPKTYPGRVVSGIGTVHFDLIGILDVLNEE